LFDDEPPAPGLGVEQRLQHHPSLGDEQIAAAGEVLVPHRGKLGNPRIRRILDPDQPPPRIRFHDQRLITTMSLTMRPTEMSWMISRREPSVARPKKPMRGPSS